MPGHRRELRSPRLASMAHLWKPDFNFRCAQDDRCDSPLASQWHDFD